MENNGTHRKAKGSNKNKETPKATKLIPTYIGFLVYSKIPCETNEDACDGFNGFTFRVKTLIKRSHERTYLLFLIDEKLSLLTKQ